MNEAQVAVVLKQARTARRCRRCRKVGISEATFYAWRKKYAGAHARAAGLSGKERKDLSTP